MNDSDRITEEGIITKTDKVIVSLLACAVNGTVPKEEHYLKADPSQVYEKSRKHSVVSMAAYALEKNGYAGIPSDVAEKFRTAMYKAVRKNILLDEERKVILAYLEDEGIKYLPLKGIIMQNLYPEAGMRQMADNDILYDDSYRDKIRKFMGDRGFRVKNPGKAPEELYYKEPVYNFEMHTALFADLPRTARYREYYDDIWSRAIRDDDKEYGYHLSDEDFYIYMTVHAAKHYYASGTGIRTLTDFYIVNRALAGMDRAHIEHELMGLGLNDFEVGMRKLAGRLFDPAGAAGTVPDDLTPEERSMLFRVFTSGAYGTEEYGIINRMKEKGIDGEVTDKKRLKYYLKRLFPDQAALMPYYPLARYKILIPAINVFRIVRGVTARHRKVMRELKIVRGQKYIK